MRDSFVLYTKISEILNRVSDEQAGKLFRAIISYEETGETPMFDDPVVEIAFIPVRQELDFNNDKWDKKCQARSEAGKKSGEARANKNKQKGTNSNKKEQTRTKRTDNEYEYVSDNEYESDNDKDIPPKSPNGGKRTQQSVVDESDLSDPVKNAVVEWLKYKHERKFTYKETSLQALIKKAREMEIQNGYEWTVKAIENSIANGWQGISWDAMDRARGQPSAYMQAIHDRVDIVDTWK